MGEYYTDRINEQLAKREEGVMSTPDMSNAAMNGDRPASEGVNEGMPDHPDCAGCQLPCDEKGYCILDEEAAWKVADAKIGSGRP